jgi:hypothetical protein
MKKVKNLNKTKTQICASLYDSNSYTFISTRSKVIDACLQLVEEFPDTFKIVSSSLIEVKIEVVDLIHCFDLYKYNESKVADGRNYV